MKFFNAESVWVKFARCQDFVFIGRDVIAMASGVHVYFFDSRSKHGRIERFDDEERGDGACCIAGHPTVSIFCVAERRSNPKISVFTYPALRNVSVCVNNERTNGYLCCAFVGTDFLASQATFPDFRLIVWDWRTGEKVSAVCTVIRDPESQTISCSPNPPHLIVQFAPKSGELSVHRLLVYSRNVALLPSELPPRPSDSKVISFSWALDGGLHLCDELLNLWAIDLDGDPAVLIRGGETPLVSASLGVPVINGYKGGVIVMGSVEDHGRVESRAIFLKRTSASLGEDWRPLWTIPLRSHPRCAKSHPRGDAIFVQGENGEMYEIIPPTRERGTRMEYLYTDGIKYEMLCSSLIHARYLCLLDDSNRLNVLDSANGVPVSQKLSLRHHGKVLCMESQVSSWTVTVSTAAGNCLFIDLSVPSSPKISNCRHLQKEPLDRMKFSEKGDALGIAASEQGRLFLVTQTMLNRGSPGIVGFISLPEQKISDFLIYETGECNRIKVLILLGNHGPNAGDKMIVYSCEMGETFQAVGESIVELPNCFGSIHYSGGRSLEIIGIPWLSKQLHAMEIKSNFRELVLTEAVPSMHRMRRIGFSFSSTAPRFITYGYDGLIIVRDSLEPRKIHGILTAYHRTEAGVKQAIISGDIVVALARNGGLLAARIRIDGKSVAKEIESTRFGIDQSANIFEDTLEKTWIDAMSASQFQAEREKFSAARLAILKDFRKLKNQVSVLLNANEKESPETRLPISTFDIDKEGRVRKIAAAAIERDFLHRNIENSIAKRNRASKYLREKFWDPLVVRPCAIFSIFGELRVSNYPLKRIAEERKSELLWTRFLRETRDLTSRLEEAVACKNTDKSARSSCIDSEIAYEINTEIAIDAKKLPIWIQDLKTRLTGALLNPYRGYIDCLEINAIVEERELRTKKRFNELFEEVRSAKNVEMAETLRRIGRLRECAMELRTTFGIEVQIDIETPKWKDAETPENVVTIKEEELSMELKDSTDTANSSTKDSAELPRCEEAFRLRALDRMMDGVLEIRWEDDLKRDVPKPECLSKDPTKFTEEDLVAIKRYEERLWTLKSDRLKYKAILEDQIVQTQEATWNGVNAFNETLTDLHWRKIEADRSILRDKLIRTRACLRHGAIVRKRKEIAQLLQEESDPGTKEVRRLQEECTTVESVIAELKTRYESLLKREKLLEGKFRSEFPELKQPMVEHLFRHYKRRPRMARATCTSVTFLIQLAKCVVNVLDHRDVLPRECLDFLRGLDNLDAMPDGLPPQIEASHWQAMCKLRRVKVETEIKVKRCAVEIAEAEQTLSIFQKACLHSRGKVSRCKDTIQDLQRSLSLAANDSEIRLVLKTGQVEVRVAGKPSDFDNAVLVQREELLRVNAAIAEAGARKLRVLEKSIELRKRIAYEEWKHACAKAKLNTLQEDLEDLKAAKITRLCRECTRKYPGEAIPDEEENARERNLIAMKDSLREAAEEESRQSRSLEMEIIKWRRKNERLDEEIEKHRAGNQALATVTREPSRLREIHFKRWNMIAITRLAYLERQIRENMEDLLTLKGTLEVFKLRTFPTLSFHG